MLLIIWDRIFGTFQEEQEGEKIKYGLTHDIENLNPVTVIDHEWVALWQDMKKTKRWKEKLKYIFLQNKVKKKLLIFHIIMKYIII